MVLDDPEQNFPAMEAQDQGAGNNPSNLGNSVCCDDFRCSDAASGATVIARMLVTQFAWLHGGNIFWWRPC